MHRSINRFARENAARQKDSARPFRASVVIEPGRSRKLQEIRVEIRVARGDDPRCHASDDRAAARTESAIVHVILATAFATDPHLTRDIAIATTQEL